MPIGGCPVRTHANRSAPVSVLRHRPTGRPRLSIAVGAALETWVDHGVDHVAVAEEP